MKDLKHIKRFNESDENLNISDVRRSFSFTYQDLKDAFKVGISEGPASPEEADYIFDEWFDTWFEKNYV